MNAQQTFAIAFEHHRQGRLDEAEVLFRQILAAQPTHAESWHHLGVIAQQKGRPDLAAKWIGHAAALNPNDAAIRVNLASACRALGQFDEAIVHCRRAIELQPQRAERHDHLGMALAGRGEWKEAIAAYRRALELWPDFAEAHYNLGNSLMECGEMDAAVTALQRAVQLKPGFAAAHNNLGNALRMLGRLAEAAAAFQNALRIEPGLAVAHNNLGNVLADQGRSEEARDEFREAIRLAPDFAQGFYNLGNALRDCGQYDEAGAAFERSLALRPEYAGAWNNLGGVLADQGRVDEAIAAYRRALELRPGDPSRLSNVIFALSCAPTQGIAPIVAEQVRWNRLHVEPLRSAWRPHVNNVDPARRLKIGYVSPDFRWHAVAFFIAPLLEAHDHSRYEIHCYASVPRPDFITARLRDSADTWRDVHDMSDEQLAQRISEDEIDILVDLAMHTAGGRLPAFAYRPAPVQLSWLAYPGSTGVAAFDYRLTDAHIDPPGTDSGDSHEKILRLPDAWCCYAPIREFPPVSALPAMQSGTMTFGSLNRFNKLHDDLLRCWARLLDAVPKSRLLIVCPGGRAQDRTRGVFAACGISTERLELVPPGEWAQFTELFSRIDLSLDSFPCNGMTTSCHALWMGLPVVTAAGASAMSRAGASLLTTVGHPEWIASNEADYIRIAAELAGDIPRLAELRAALRPQMQASPLMDAPRFAGHVEAAYRTMWERWCEGHRRG